MNSAGKSMQLIAEHWRWRIAIGFVVLVFLTGGSARSDVTSLLLLRPLATITFVFLFAWSWRTALLEARHISWLFAAMFALVQFHLIALPPAVWMALPGRELVVDAFRVTATSPGWMPISLSPIEGWNALFSLLVPAAGGLAMLTAGRSATRALASALMVMVLLSAFLGFLQAIGPSNGPLYLYRITNNGSAVGLFANRNHQAMVLACFFPLLAAWASTVSGSAERRRAQLIVALAVAVTIVPLLLVTGSRAGLLLGVVGIASGWLIFQRPEGGYRARGDLRWRRFLIGGTVLAGVVLVLIVALSTRSTALTRLVHGDEAGELRLRALPYLLDAVWTYFPVGSGAGSFVPVYKIVEPNHLLSPAYFNHAHNDVVEVALEHGLPGMILMAVALVLWFGGVVRLQRIRRACKGVLDAGQLFGWAGAAILLILGLGSVADYPLRVPSVATLAAFAAVWMAWATTFARSAINDSNWTRGGLVAQPNVETN